MTPHPTHSARLTSNSPNLSLMDSVMKLKVWPFAKANHRTLLVYELR